VHQAQLTQATQSRGEKRGEESRVLRKEWEETKERSSDA
jgi:hypothetical protein